MAYTGVVWPLLRLHEVDSTLSTAWPYLCSVIYMGDQWGGGTVGRDPGRTGAGGGRRERKGRQAGVLRGRESGEKCKNAYLGHLLSIKILSETKCYLICIYLILRLPGRQANENSPLGLQTEAYFSPIKLETLSRWLRHSCDSNVMKCCRLNCQNT